MVLALRSSVQVIQIGAIQEALPSWSQQPTSAHQTTLFQVTTVDGATLPALTLTLPCPCSLRLQSTVPVLFPFPTAGMCSVSLYVSTLSIKQILTYYNYNEYYFFVVNDSVTNSSPNCMLKAGLHSQKV